MDNIIFTLFTVFVSFLAGSVIGFLIGRKMPTPHILSENRITVQSVILLLLFVAFFISVTIDALSIDYETPLALYGLIGIPVGFLFKPAGLFNSDKKDKD